VLLEKIHLHVEISRQPNVIGIEKRQQLAPRVLNS
jgi:hypothetical protein